MTRMWGVDPRLLCREHLLGEHVELHMLVGTIQNHPHGEAIVRGQADEGNVETALIEQRHGELAAELARRGYDHDSPLVYEDDLVIGEIDPTANRSELAARCKQCRLRLADDGDV